MPPPPVAMGPAGQSTSALPFAVTVNQVGGAGIGHVALLTLSIERAIPAGSAIVALDTALPGPPLSDWSPARRPDEPLVARDVIGRVPTHARKALRANLARMRCGAGKS